MNFEGQNISLKDALFVDNITGDIENFRQVFFDTQNFL